MLELNELLKQFHPITVLCISNYEIMFNYLYLNLGTHNNLDPLYRKGHELCT